MKRIYAVPEYVVMTHIQKDVSKHLQTIGHEIAYKYIDGCSLSDLAKAQGLENFDVALPIDWVRRFENQTGFNPVGHIVMDYSSNTFGKTVAVTIEGKIAYKIFLHINNIDLG